MSWSCLAMFVFQLCPLRLKKVSNFSLYKEEKEIMRQLPHPHISGLGFQFLNPSRPFFLGEERAMLVYTATVLCTLSSNLGGHSLLVIALKFIFMVSNMKTGEKTIKK